MAKETTDKSALAKSKAAADTMGAEKEYLAQADWDEVEGMEFGGQSDILVLAEQQVAGPLIYLGHSEITTDLGASSSHTARAADGENYRLPLHATFQKAMDQANLQVGDVFFLKRFDDQLKKKGKGAGKPMHIYAIKVTQRATVSAPA